MDLFYLIIGLALLVGAGDALVRGAVSLSLRFGIPAFIVSATVVAFGTSAPELLISVEAALKGSPGIALGNVIGSNIANVLLVLGVPAVLVPLAANGTDAHRNLYFMIAATLAFAALVLTGIIPLWGGVVLLALAIAMVWDSVRQGLRAGLVDDDIAAELQQDDGGDARMAPWKIAGLIAIGMIGLPFGAHLLIEGARGIAFDLGISEAVVGLTLVAIGTSLPELATTVVAALKRQTEVAIGNVIGSNIFNLTAIIGTAAIFAPLEVPDEILSRDLWVMLGATLVLIPFVLLCRPIGRITGLAFLVVYVAYIYVAFV